MIPASVTWDCTEAHQFVERPAYADHPACRAWPTLSAFQAMEAGAAAQNQLTTTINFAGSDN